MAQADALSPVVLVVDDEAAVRVVARRILEPAGYRVIEAANGFDAVDMIGGPVDLLIADLEMPALGGVEMVRRIRTVRRDLKVLYVTGHIDVLMDDRPTLWEGEAFLEKPFTKEGLLEAVSLLLFGSTTRPR